MRKRNLFFCNIPRSTKRGSGRSGMAADEEIRTIRSTVGIIMIDQRRRRRRFVF